MFTIRPTAEFLRERGLERGGKVQKYIDSECIRCTDSFVPFRDGFLKKSVTLGTVIGSGLLRYIAPYARVNYYNNKGRGTQGLNNPLRQGKRGRLWWERMKPVHLKHILNGAVRISGARRR